ncbi:MAG: molybdenum cofactor biosynthesis protein B [Halobacteriota archaeon]|nr:molybdenum cofactor biosynthesis protein B [Halobacteriota archaeon]
MSTHEHKRGIKMHFKSAVLTISSSRYSELVNGETIDDKSGDLIRRMLEEGGHEVVEYDLLPDDKLAIEVKVSQLVRGSADVIISTGGTGLATKDVTIEAVSPMMEKEITGFGELFRYKSVEEVGSAVVLSRAIAGVIKGKLIFCIPGSPNAVELAMSEIILPEIPHIMRHIRE